MKKLFNILTILGLLSPLSTSARELNCVDIVPTPRVRFYTSYGKLKYDFSKSKSQITNLSRKYDIMEQGLFAAGLALINVNWEVTVNSMSKILRNNKVCVVPVSIDFYLGYSNPVIYIDRNLKPGSCHYNLVMRHEQTHQQINTSALEYFIPLFHQAFEQIIPHISAQEVKHNSESAVNQATLELTRKYSERLSPLVEVFKKELLIEQGKLDNRTNYEFEGTLCPAED